LGDLVFGKFVDSDRVEFPYGLHRRERLQICFDPAPLFRVLFSDDRGLRVGVVGHEVVLELGGDDVVRVAGDRGQEFGIGVIGEWVIAGLDEHSRVEIAITKVAANVIVIIQDLAQRFDGAIEACDVEVFGLQSGTLDRQELEGPDFGKDEDEAGVEVTAEAWLLSVGFPVVISGCLEEVVSELGEVGAGNVCGKVLFVEDGFGTGDVGDEVAYRVAIDADGGFFAADDVAELKAVGFKECPSDEIV